MPEYLSPGVYVEEIDGPQPFEGVSTSTTGAVGYTERGPITGKPLLVTSFNEFQRTFGGFIEEPEPAIVAKWGKKQNLEGGQFWSFPLSVKGFFDNGGQRLYVKRVFSKTAKPSTGTLGTGLVAEVERDVAAGSSTLKLRHLFGIWNGVTLPTIYRDGVPLVQNAKVVSYDANQREVVIDKPLLQGLKAGRDFVEIVARDGNKKTLTFTAMSPGEWGDDISIRTRPVAGSQLKFLAPPATNADPDVIAPVLATQTRSWTVTVDDASKIKANDTIKIAGSSYTVDKVDTAAKKITLQIDPNLAKADLTARIGAIVDNTTTVDKDGVNPSPKITAHDASASDWVVTVDVTRTGGSVFLANDTVSIAGERYKATGVATPSPGKQALTLDSADTPFGFAFEVGGLVRRLRGITTTTKQISVQHANQLYAGALVELDNGATKEYLTIDSIDNSTTLTLNAIPTKKYLDADVLRVVELEVSASYDGTTETLGNLPLTSTGGIPDLIGDINGESSLIRVQGGADFNGADIKQFPTIANGLWQQLNGGDSSLGDLSVDDFVGEDHGSGQRTGIQALEDIDDIAICTVPGMWAESVQAALIEHCELLRYRFAILDVADDLSIEEVQTARDPIDTKFAALYYPWIVVHDPSSKQDVRLAPSAHIAGVYARVDNERGVHKAPANEVIRGINLFNGIAQDVNKREQDVLNPKAINVLRFFPGRGNRVWGARVLTSLTEWKYINVRRLFIFVEHSIDKNTQWVVFEPNDEPLWAKIRQVVTNFLTDLWHAGMLQGAKAEEAFFVKVDRTTMSQDDIDNGRLIIHVGIAPVKPAEFVIFRIQQKTLDQQAS